MYVCIYVCVEKKSVINNFVASIITLSLCDSKILLSSSYVECPTATTGTEIQYACVREREREEADYY